MTSCHCSVLFWLLPHHCINCIRMNWFCVPNADKSAHTSYQWKRRLLRFSSRGHIIRNTKLWRPPAEFLKTRPVEDEMKEPASEEAVSQSDCSRLITYACILDFFFFSSKWIKSKANGRCGGSDVAQVRSRQENESTALKGNSWGRGEPLLWFKFKKKKHVEFPLSFS